MENEEIKTMLGSLGEKIKKEVASKEELERTKSELSELQKKITELQGKTADAAAITELQEKHNTLEKSIQAMAEKLEKSKNQKDAEPKSLKSAIVELLSQKDADGKNVFRENITKQRKAVFDMKVATTDFVGDAYRSQLKPGITFEKLTENTIMPLFNLVNMPEGKDIITWLEGSATINVGYVAEGNPIGSSSTGSATAKTRSLAKISAIMPFTSEALDMPESFAERLQRRMMDATNVWLNQELLSGDGNDSTQPNHIYGLISQGSTPFVAPTGLTFDYPNIDDLVKACLVQAVPYKPTHVIMNTKTYVKYSSEKDSTGQYIIREVNGKEMLGGLQLVISEGMSDGSMMLVDRAVLEFWVKQGMRMIVTQMDGTDISEDKWKAILFWRGQELVEGFDKKANIYVSDIETAISNIATVAIGG